MVAPQPQSLAVPFKVLGLVTATPAHAGAARHARSTHRSAGQNASTFGAWAACHAGPPGIPS
eukprot:5321389-Lingulodinium_polyedra.AAC.1